VVVVVVVVFIPSTLAASKRWVFRSMAGVWSCVG
jgi:hypothetical protein